MVLVCVFGILCVSVFLGYFYVVSHANAVDCLERPSGNDLLCVKRDVKQLLTHSLTLVRRTKCWRSNNKETSR